MRSPWTKRFIASRTSRNKFAKDERFRYISTMALAPPVVLTIAGFDPSSGAGSYGRHKDHRLPRLLRGSLHHCSDGAIDGGGSTGGSGRRRTGGGDARGAGIRCRDCRRAHRNARLGKVVRAVADFLAAKKMPNVVLDPILKSSSGTDLVDAAGTRLLIEKLLPLATVVTPNIDEASALTGLPVTDPEQMRAAARKLHEMGASAVVVTGGHLEKAIDLLSFTGKPRRRAGTVQVRPVAVQLDAWHGMRLCHLGSLPSGHGTGVARGRLVGQSLCCRGDQQCPSAGTWHWPGSSSLSHAAATAGYRCGPGAGELSSGLRRTRSGFAGRIGI